MDGRVKKIITVIAILTMILSMTACGGGHPNNSASETETVRTEAVGNVTTENSNNEDIENTSAGKEQEVKIRFTDGTNEVIIILNDSKLSESLVAQLPFTFDFEDYAHNEKNGTVPKKLTTDKSFEAECPKGSLGYFAPWGNLCLFFEVAPAYPEQYVLGTVEGDPDDIKKLGNKVTVEIAE